MQNILYKEFDFKGCGDRIVRLFEDEPYLFYLDSSQFNKTRGRFSFIGFDPFEVVRASGDEAEIELRDAHNKMRTLDECPLTPFPAGMVGILNYDYGFPVNKISKRSKSDLDLPDCLFGLYDRIITVDHAKNKLIVTSSGLPEKDEIKREERARGRINEVVQQIKECLATIEQVKEELEQDVSEPLNDFISNFSKESYCQAVQKALDYIAEGDIYQVNLSQRFVHSLPEGVSGLEIYDCLKNASPSSYGGYFKACDFEIISSSPEQFLKVEEGTVTTRPMKGTRPRGVTGEEDANFRNEIIQSEKEKAELLMVTDLERNDIGKVCRYGTVKVDEMRTIEEYETVFQATSSVSGQLQENKDCFDVIKACFPGGSITGCPKLRSMELIEELEPTRRGFYTGSLGYISFTGRMELNILIRTLLIKGDRAYFQVGGGIVADSVPEKEYDETLLKAKAMMASLKKVTQEPLTKK